MINNERPRSKSGGYAKWSFGRTFSYSLDTLLTDGDPPLSPRPQINSNFITTNFHQKCHFSDS